MSTERCSACSHMKEDFSPTQNDRVKLSVRLTSPWSRSLTQHLINKASPAPIWTIEPLILEYFIVQNQNTSARIQLVSIWSSQTEFQRFFTSFASVLVAVTQTGLLSFSLNIYLEIKPHTCFSLLLIQLSFSLKVLTVININKQTLIDWDHQPERSLCFVSLCN